MYTALYIGGGGLLALLLLRQTLRWWRGRLDVDPVSENWLAQRRGMSEHE